MESYICRERFSLKTRCIRVWGIYAMPSHARTPETPVPLTHRPPNTSSPYRPTSSERSRGAPSERGSRVDQSSEPLKKSDQVTDHRFGGRGPAEGPKQHTDDEETADPRPPHPPTASRHPDAPKEHQESKAAGLISHPSRSKRATK